MADDRYSDPRGSGWSDRDRDRAGGRSEARQDAERARPGWGSTEDSSRGWRGRHEQDERGGGGGFFERAGEEIRSWFGDDDDQNRSGSDRDRSGRQGQRHSAGWSDDTRGQSWRGSSQQRASRYGDEHGFGGFQGDYGGGSRQGGFGGQGDWHSGRQSFGGGGPGDRQGDRQGAGGGFSSGGRHFGYNDMSGMMGGFGNQRFGSSQDDHYISWRNRQLEELDRDYQEYCRENEQRFHQDFDSWRQNRQSQPARQQVGEHPGQGGSDEAAGTGSTPAAGSSGSDTSGPPSGAPAGGGSSFIGSGSSTDPSAATAGGGGDPTPDPASPGSTRGSGRSR